MIEIFHIDYLELQKRGVVLENVLCRLPEMESKKISTMKSIPAMWLRGLGRLMLQEQLLKKGCSLSQLLYTDHGKPYLEGQNFSFNISHSGSKVVCAINHYGGTIGVDIEKLDRRFKYNLIKSYFSSKEQSTIEMATDSMKEGVKIWSAKESVSKAIGKGVSLIKKIEVDLSRQLAYYEHQKWCVIQYVMNEKYIMHFSLSIKNTDNQYNVILFDFFSKKSIKK